MSYNIKGVDISYCQKGIDYKALKNAGVKFAILRAGAAKRKDSLLDKHIKGCQKYGIDYGFYWYSYAMSVSEAKAEAETCLKVIAKYAKPDYPVFFDMEDETQINGLSDKIRTDMAIAFCEAIKKGGYPCGIYANPSWLESYFEKSRLVGKYDIWLANWTYDPNKPSEYDYGQVMWQWGLEYIGMKIDGDICFIDYPAKTAKWYKDYDAANKPTQNDTNTDKTNNNTLKKGDKITLKNAPLYASSTSKNKANTISGTYYVHSDGIINDRIRITTPKGCKDCTGWVNISDCGTTNKVQSNAQNALKKGDTVKVKVGAKTYNGKSLMIFVYTQKYEVMEISGDRVVIGQKGVITAAMKASDLIIVK